MLGTHFAETLMLHPQTTPGKGSKREECGGWVRECNAQRRGALAPKCLSVRMFGCILVGSRTVHDLPFVVCRDSNSRGNTQCCSEPCQSANVPDVSSIRMFFRGAGLSACCSARP